jgi:hypothetical protein
MGGPPKSILAISDLTLGGSTDRADVLIGNAQQSLLQQRDRWFESGSLQRRVSNELYRRWAAMEPGRAQTGCRWSRFQLWLALAQAVLAVFAEGR